MTAVGTDNRYVAVSGSPAAVAAAFGTQIVNYVVDGHGEHAPANDLSVPASVADLVQAVSGLTTFGHRVKTADFGPPDAFVPGTPCSSYYGEKIATSLPKFHGKKLPFNVCGYTVGTLRTAYGMDRAARAAPARPSRSPTPTTRRSSRPTPTRTPRCTATRRSRPASSPT